MKIPEGWKLVPVEPTEEMCRAAESCKYASSSKQWLGGYTPENVEGIYKTMLAVAPTPPAQEDEPVYDSYLTNSVIISRAGDGPLFVGVGDKAYCRLDRYTIMPTEQYDELRRAAGEVYALVKDNSSVPIRPVLNLRAALEK
jgi:hypothetical protein